MKGQYSSKRAEVIRKRDLPPIVRNRKRSFVVTVLGLLVLTVAASTFAAPDIAANGSPVPSYGKGTRELMVFTDYFCFPCSMIEADLEPAINKVLDRGDVKVTFVDVPIHPPTPMYSKYYLFATKGAGGYKNAVHARNVLFSLARQNLARTEADLEKAFAAKGVSFRTFNTKPVISEWNKILKQYKVKSTPTCILKYSETDVRRYEGTDNIRNRLLPELDAMVKKK
jgi:thiol:disulfide interchange protein DsbA